MLKFRVVFFDTLLKCEKKIGRIISQNELSEATGINLQTLKKWRDGTIRSRVHMPTVLKLIEFCRDVLDDDTIGLTDIIQVYED